MPTTLQEQAKALGAPTRHRIFDHLVAAQRPVGVAELTEQFGLNHNAIRQHLHQLVGAELVVESTARPSGRGRPRLQYVVAPAAANRWGGAGPYERLSVLLAEVTRSGDSPEDVGRRSVMGPSSATTADPTADATTIAGPEEAISTLVAEMARHGFAPTVERSGPRVDVVLGECPFASAATVDPSTVCQLHLGMARGVAERVGGLVVDGLEVADPHRGGCRLTCHESPAPPLP